MAVYISGTSRQLSPDSEHAIRLTFYTRVRGGSLIQLVLRDILVRRR